MHKKNNERRNKKMGKSLTVYLLFAMITALFWLKMGIDDIDDNEFKKSSNAGKIGYALGVTIGAIMAGLAFPIIFMYIMLKFLYRR